MVVAAQLLGGIAAAGVASAILPGPLGVNVRLGTGISIARGVFIEMFTTTMLAITVIMLAAIKHRATYLAPIGIGIAIFVGHLCSKSLLLLSSIESQVSEINSSQVYSGPGQVSTQPEHSVQML